MKKLLIIVFFTIGASQAAEHFTGKYFESYRKKTVDYIEAECLKGEDPAAFSTNFWGKPNWLNVLYKCHQIASKNKEYALENELLFKDCISFFQKVKDHVATYNSNKEDVVNAVTEFENFFIEKRSEALEKRRKRAQELIQNRKEAQQADNLRRAHDTLRSLPEYSSEQVDFLDECGTLLKKQPKTNHERLMRKQCSQLLVQIKKGYLLGLQKQSYETALGFGDGTVDALESLKNDMMYSNEFLEPKIGNPQSYWEKIQPDLQAFLLAEKDKKHTQFDERFSNLCINDCKKFVEQKDLIDGDGKYDSYQYRRCEASLLSSLTKFITSSDSYTNNLLGYTKEKIDTLAKLRLIITSIHRQMLIESLRSK